MVLVVFANSLDKLDLICYRQTTRISPSNDIRNILYGKSFANGRLLERHSNRRIDVMAAEAGARVIIVIEAEIDALVEAAGDAEAEAQ